MFIRTFQRFTEQLTPKHRRKSWALNNLDQKLNAYLPFRRGFFVEAGANDGIRQSNTLYFERYRGWRGLLIEAIPELAEKCKINRPLSSVENCALVSAGFPNQFITLHYRDLMSTVKGSFADPEIELRHITTGEKFMKQGDPPREINVPASTLGSILNRYHISDFDLLSLDVEGYEAEVLSGLQFDYHRPNYILAEVRDKKIINDILLPRYDEVVILHENENYADVLYKRK